MESSLHPFINVYRSRFCGKTLISPDALTPPKNMLSQKNIHGIHMILKVCSVQVYRYTYIDNYRYQGIYFYIYIYINIINFGLLGRHQGGPWIFLPAWACQVNYTCPNHQSYSSLARVYPGEAALLVVNSGGVIQRQIQGPSTNRVPTLPKMNHQKKHRHVFFDVYTLPERLPACPWLEDDCFLLSFQELC